MVELTIAQAFEQGVGHHRTGNIQSAEAIYRKILAVDPNHADSLHLLGVIAVQVGRHDAAIELIGAAIRLKPDVPAYRSNLSNALNAVGRPTEAAAQCREAIQLDPNFPPGHTNLGYALKSQGLLDEAQEAFEAAARINPTDPMARLNLGNLAFERRQLELARMHFETALGMAPELAEAHNAIGTVLAETKDFRTAEPHYREAVRLKPELVEARTNLALALRELKQLDEAEIVARSAIQMAPQLGDAYDNLGLVLSDQERYAEAEAAFSEALRLKPAFARAHSNLAVVLNRTERYAEAEAQARESLRLKPDYAPAHGNLATALHEQGKLEEARLHLREALRLEPESGEAHNNMGVALQEQERYEEAETLGRRAVELKPDDHGALTNLANTLTALGQREEALELFQRAIALKPNFADAHVNLAIALLQVERFEEAWPEYEWRWRVQKWQYKPRDFTEPLWTGQDIPPGQTLLLHGEQGLGDTLHFCRYVPKAASRARIVLEVPEPLVRLMRCLPGVDQVIARGEKLPHFDWQTPLMTLPLAFGTTKETIPNDVPYLTTDPALVARWRERTDALSGLKVGLVWAGNPKLPRDRQRSISFAKFAGLFELEGVSFVSLQKGDGERPSEGSRVHDWTAEIEDFADTAALIETLDLVIGVDTSVIHVAGALAKPTWLLNRYSPDWRWLREGEGSDWYPTLRQFRQPAPGDWESVLLRVTEALKELAVPPKRRGRKSKG
jgi:tetratricopeptide (TPR) repeat protein